MQRRLMWRMFTPVLAVSILVLLIGAAAAWYVERSNTRVSNELDEQLANAANSVRLSFAVRDSRVDVDRFLATRDEAFLHAAVANRSRLEQALADLIDAHPTLAPGVVTSAAPNVSPVQRTGETEASDETNAGAPVNDIELLRELRAAAPILLDELVQLAAAPDLESATDLRERWTNQLVRPAERLFDHHREAAVNHSQRNRVLAKWFGGSIIVLGLCGSAAGMLAGYGMARSITRSILELGGEVEEIADRLRLVRAEDESLDESETPIEPRVRDLPDIRNAVRSLADRTSSVVEELAETRQQAERSEHFASLGKLAAGLAHEIRNPLTAMKLIVQAAAEQQTAPQGRDLEVLEEEIDRLDALVGTFLDFARPSRPIRTTLDVADLVAQVVEFVRPRADSQHVQVAFQPCGELAPIVADGSQIRQVILNLLLNAIDAMPEGGEATVRVAPTLDEITNEAGVQIDVSDNGTGLSNETQAKLFEPFFTTKIAGIGLGLAISKRIVEAHGGSIEGNNNAGRGATFTARLPQGTPSR